MRDFAKMILTLVAVFGVIFLLIFAIVGVPIYFDAEGRLYKEVDGYLQTVQGPTARRVFDIARPHLSEAEEFEFAGRLSAINASPKRFKGDEYDRFMWNLCILLREVEEEKGVDAKSKLAWEIRNLYDDIRWINGRMAYDAVTKYEYTEEQFVDDKETFPRMCEELNELIAVSQNSSPKSKS